MKASLPVLLTLWLFGAVLFTPVTSHGQTPKLQLDRTPNTYDRDASDSADVDDDPVQRVARITYIQGEVSFLRAGVKEWSDATENLPLLTGDQIYVGSRGRAEIQFGRGNYVRLSEQTALTITELSHTAALLEVTEGIAIVRLERYGSAWDRFEVDTPNSALVLKQDGLYRVNVRGANDSEVIIRRGLAEVFSDDGNFKVREGQRLTIDTSANGRLQIAADTSNDDWDRWSYDRDRQTNYATVAAAPDYVSQYETNYNSFYGASELTNYGYWTSYSNYGNCWVPRVSAGWAPYRAGQWLWIPRVGWTWLSSEPWGWAPYHYGRWVFLNNIGWAWSPGFNTHYYNYGYSYYQWRPALVGFFNCPTPRGDYVGWYPLAPGDHWRRPDHFGGNGFGDNNGHRHLQLPVARDGARRLNDRTGNSDGSTRRPRHGITVIPIEGFAGNGRTKFKPNAPDHDLNNWVNTRARVGLPDLGADGKAYVNAKVVKPGDTQNSFRPAAKPPEEVIGRSVVTRQRTLDTQAGSEVPRQRRFIGSPTFRQNGDDSLTNRKARRGEEITGGNPSANDAGVNPHRRNRNADAANGSGANGSPNGVITDEVLRKRIGRTIEEHPETQKGNDANNQDHGANWKARSRSIPATNPEGDADANARKRERETRHNETPSANGDAEHPKDASKRTYVPREQPSNDGQNDAEERKARRAERQQQEQQQQEHERQQRQEQERQRQEQEQQQQRQEQERQQRRAERQQQEQQYQEQRRQQQEQQQQEQRRQQQEHEQRRAERQQQEQQRQQQEQQRQQQEQQQEQQRQQQRHEEKQRRKNGDN
ncbi:MAG: FecR domain-containing protein [Acidobacteria bacterium]|nr:FecR domain-containing protein [Acidobacteriota bacterium]